MTLKSVTFLNWLVGSLALVVAVLYPVYRDLMVVEGAKAAVGDVVDVIAHRERERHVKTNGRLTYFRGNQPDILHRDLGVPTGGTADEFTYSAFSDRNHELVVRAITKDSALRAGRLPLLVYTYPVGKAEELPDDKQRARGEWSALSGRKAGLLSAFKL